MEGERRRLSDASSFGSLSASRTLTADLRRFVGHDEARAVLADELGSDFSRAGLLHELTAIRARLPAGLLCDRMFGEPDFLATSASAARIREWELSRSVLVRAFDGLAGPIFHARISHSQGVALAAVVSGGPFPVGVDLERADREISDAAFARFFSASEVAFLADRLDHWVLKEACFKAHPRADETIVADYKVTGVLAGGDYELRCGKGEPVGFRARLGSIVGYRYAFAIELPKG